MSQYICTGTNPVVLAQVVSAATGITGSLFNSQVAARLLKDNGFEVVHSEKAPKAKADKKALVKDLSEKIHVLEKRKRPADDLASLLGYIVKFNGGVATGSHPECIQGYVAKLGLAETPTLAAAKLIVKELRVAIKTAKEELKVARHA